MKRKIKIYLDTSVPSAYYDEEKPERQRITQLWWENELPKYDVVISSITLSELEKTPDLDKRTKFLELIKGIEILPITLECDVLASKYIENGIIPEKVRNDALHIAVATVYSVDIIVSWNFEHMVNHKTRVKVKGVNLLNDYREIEIISPQELCGGEYE